MTSADPARLIALRAALDRAYELRSELHEHLADVTAVRVVTRLGEALDD
jgi:hypothetical protein